MAATCDACSKNEGTHHVTVAVTIFGPLTTKVKRVQFWLCDTCEIASRQVMANDREIQHRVAWRLTQDPQLFSRWRDWRERRYARYAARAEGKEKQ